MTGKSGRLVILTVITISKSHVVFHAMNINKYFITFRHQLLHQPLHKINELGRPEGPIPTNWETNVERRQRKQVLIVVDGNNNDDSDSSGDFGVKRGRKFVGWYDHDDNVGGPPSTLVLARACPTSGKRPFINDVTVETSVLCRYFFA